MKMKGRMLSALAVACLLASCSTNVVYEGQAGNLFLSIDKTGRITSLKDDAAGKDYAADSSYLITCNKYGNDSLMLNPVSAQKVGDGLLELKYPGDIKLKVQIKKVDEYFRMEIVDADPVKEISYIKWGPYYTNMQSFVGAVLGMVRSDDFSIGLMTLDPNTDFPSERPHVAQYTEEGASLQLYAYDHTRGVFRDHRNMGKENTLRCNKPIPVTVVGSKVALYSSEPGYEKELDAIEKIELNEGLPHPLINGVWNKRTREQARFCLWSFYNEENFDEHLKLAETIGAGVFCNPAGFFKNWGHFEIDLKRYPGGAAGLKAMSDKAMSKGIGTTFYTLTTFTKPINAPEPYMSPVLDKRFSMWRNKGVLAENLTKEDDEITLNMDEKVLATVNKNKSLKVDNELINFSKAEEKDGKIVLSKCKRGMFYTDVTTHTQGAEVSFPFFSGYSNYYPGTIDFLEEEAENAFNQFHATNQKMYMIDGYESCMEAGYSTYGGNMFADRFYKLCKENNKDIYWTGSRYSPYSWHHLSHISWGEGDQDKGIRGTMLDYRITLQVLLKSDLMPKKLGQFYPDHATVADFEWLMAFATGWDSGLDILLNLKNFKKNPNYDAIVEKLALWSQARKEKAFTEEQLRGMRQTDREYTLSKNADGTWNLQFVKFWQSDRVKIRPSEDLPVKSLSGAKIKPCGIDWSWTHNPATYYEVILSNDMVHATGAQQSEWEVTYPKFVNPKGSWYQTDIRHFQYVLRLPEDAPCAVSNFELTYNGYKIKIPMTLKPGQYLTMPQLVPIVCIYDKNHQLVEEKQIRGDIPSVMTGDTAKITLSCKPEKSGEKPELIMNVRCQNGYFYPGWLTNK